MLVHQFMHTRSTDNANQTSIDISISILPDTVHMDTAAEVVSISLGIANAGTTGLILGSTTNQTFTIAENTSTKNTIGFVGPFRRNVEEGDSFSLEAILKDSTGTALAMNGANALEMHYAFSDADAVSSRNRDADISANEALTDGKTTLEMAFISSGAHARTSGELTVTLTARNPLPSDWEIESGANVITFVIAAP